LIRDLRVTPAEMMPTGHDEQASIMAGQLFACGVRIVIAKVDKVKEKIRKQRKKSKK